MRRPNSRMMRRSAPPVPNFFISQLRQAMSESMVQIRSVTKIYERGKQKVEVLHGLSLEIPKGDFVALMGPSGSGKTTLLNLIGGLDQPTSGEISVGRRPASQPPVRPPPR